MLPAIFFGHGTPLNALAQNQYTEVWQRMGEEIPRPKAILAISAHWFVPGTGVTINTAPPTIHDFGGFPSELYQVQYPAPGDPALAHRVQQLLAPLPVTLDTSWGLDHGTWSVLCHVYPHADIPVVQLSIDASKPARFHYEIGQKLAPLRDEGILLAGSGNVVHNLRAYMWARMSDPAGVAPPHDWAVNFEKRTRELVLAHREQTLIDYPSIGRDAMLSIPTPDHYLPLLYILGARQATDPISFPVDGIDGGSVSMLTVRLG